MKTTVWQTSDGVVFVGIEPPLKQGELEKIQIEILGYIKAINQFALAGKIGKRKGMSHFRITTPHPWPGLKKAVEIGLEKGLMEPRQKV